MTLKNFSYFQGDPSIYEFDCEKDASDRKDIPEADSSPVVSLGKTRERDAKGEKRVIPHAPLGRAALWETTEDKSLPEKPPTEGLDEGITISHLRCRPCILQL